MFQLEKVKGIIFDYGGTLDSNGLHWAEVIWSAYREAAVPVSYEAFRDAYVHGERTLGRNPIVQPCHNFRDMLRFKIRLQLDWLVANGHLDTAHVQDNAGATADTPAETCTEAPAEAGTPAETCTEAPAETGATAETFAETCPPVEAPATTEAKAPGPHVSGASHEAAAFSPLVRRLADTCYRFARQSIDNACPLLDALHGRYPLVLVSNFYGNIETVLKDFRLDAYFDAIVESAVVGIRKPDPAIFRLGMEKLDLAAEETVVIGDSHDKDILPAASLGCQTIWLKNIGWKPYTGGETADAILSDFGNLKDIFNI